ncbi:unnamed protein product [Didymodactylos carnosus]|uniref:EamA domain-containing protein n=1 Tax=Didymodactylos carnosus TaxID=1234261 RepID=A0A814ECU4_9BILA|nr:unnamed protein product [Didymodactylos carnosus]CAF0970443.1 unnamed protein product [Didymodactylos carnosus]CAF3516635.1 unnamed protein product [Didymodactylos carnosus]CAF3743557.1 unnamed protein product [Didymodactylos carnosus]
MNDVHESTIFSTDLENHHDELLTDAEKDILTLPIDLSVEPVYLSHEYSDVINTVTRKSLPSIQNIFRNLSGIFYSLAASFLFTCSTFVAKQLQIDLLDAILLRFTLQTVTAITFIIYKKYSIFSGTKKQLLLQFVCCLSGAGGFMAFFVGYRYIPLPDLTTLLYTRVIWTLVLTSIIYREKPSITILGAIPLTILGVIFVAQPSFLFKNKIPQVSNMTFNSTITVTDSSNHRYIGFSIGLFCALSSSVNIILFKKLVTCKIKPSIMMFQFATVALIILIINQFYKYFIEHKVIVLLKWQFIFASFICLLQILAAILVQKAIKRENPSIFTIVCSSDIIYAIILQNLFTNMKSNLFALLGSLLVISGVLLVGGYKLFKTKCKKDKN